MVVWTAVEKKRPTYDLVAVKAILGEAKSLAITTSALGDAVSLGFDRAGIASVVRSIDRRMFVKSMTTFADHRVWQDVYHAPLDDLILYIKFQADVVTEFRVMAFKER